MIEQALEHYEKGEYDKAHALYRQMLDDEPDNHQVLYMLALCEQRTGQFAAARERLAACARLAPAIAPYHYALGGLEMRLGQPTAALDSYRRAAESNPNHAAAHMGAGYVLLSLGRYDEAIDALHTALRADPELNEAYAHLGVALLDSGRLDEAARYLQEAVSRKPDDPYIQSHLGRAFLAMGRHAFAVQCLRNALRPYPDQYPLWLWLGQALNGMGEYSEALVAFSKSLELGPETLEALAGIATANLELGDNEAALVALSRLRQRQPGIPEHALQAATAARRLGRYAEALAWLAPLGELPEAMRIKAAVLLDQQRPTEALAAMAHWPAGIPDSEIAALKIDAHLRCGEIADAREALAAFETAGNPPALGDLFRARLALAENDPAEAAARLESEHKTLPPAYRRAWRRYQWQALTRAGRHEAAAALLADHTAGDSPMSLASVIAEQHPESAEEPATALDQDVLWSWPPSGPGDDLADPILVHGWPGSGRGALLFALAQDPACSVIHDAIGDQNERREALCWPRGAATLTALDESAIRLARQRYWRAARRRLAPAELDRPMADGLWFTARALPTIYRLFPGARVIVVDRDLEALKIEWQLAGFTDLERLPDLWHEEQAFLQQARQQIPLQFIDLPHTVWQTAPAAALAPLTALFPGLDLTALGERLTRIADHLLNTAQRQ